MGKGPLRLNTQTRPEHMHSTYPTPDLGRAWSYTYSSIVSRVALPFIPFHTSLWWSAYVGVVIRQQFGKPFLFKRCAIHRASFVRNPFFLPDPQNLDLACSWRMKSAMAAWSSSVGRMGQANPHSCTTWPCSVCSQNKFQVEGEGR